MSKIKYYGLPLQYTNDLDLMYKAISMYAAVQNIKYNRTYLRKQHIKVLSFYVLLGYSDYTKETISKSLGINTFNLNQINSELTKRKCLVIDTNNYRKKHLSKDLEAVREYFSKGEYDKLFLVNFINE